MSHDPVRWFERLFLKGKTLDEVLLDGAVERWKTSWSEQSREEKRRRMHFVLAMAAELNEIRKTNRHATAWCEMAIEDVIIGDWKSMPMHISMFEFKDDDPTYRERYAPIFARFRQICEEAMVVASTKDKA